MVMNEEVTGLISYIGTKHTTIRYDQTLYQWNMTVANNPNIQAVSYSEVSSLVIGKHSWQITGDYACNSKPQTVLLSLRSQSFLTTLSFYLCSSARVTRASSPVLAGSASPSSLGVTTSTTATTAQTRPTVAGSPLTRPTRGSSCRLPPG